MSDQDYFTASRKAQINAWVAGHMLRGAGWAAIVVIGFGILFGVTYIVGTWLPAESRETPDPNTWSSLVLSVETVTA